MSTKKASVNISSSNGIRFTAIPNGWENEDLGDIHEFEHLYEDDQEKMLKLSKGAKPESFEFEWCGGTAEAMIKSMEETITNLKRLSKTHFFVGDVD